MKNDLPQHILAGEIYRPTYPVGRDLVVLGVARARFMSSAQPLVVLASTQKAQKPDFWQSFRPSTSCDGIVRQMVGRGDLELRDPQYLSLCTKVDKWDLGILPQYWDVLERNLMPGALIDKDQEPSVVTGHFYAYSDGCPQIILTCECENGRQQRGSLPLWQVIDGHVSILRPSMKGQAPRYVHHRGGVA